jgi:hypothetical protein
MRHHTDKAAQTISSKAWGSANATSASLAPVYSSRAWLIDAVSGELYLFPGMARIKVKRFLPTTRAQRKERKLQQTIQQEQV